MSNTKNISAEIESQHSAEQSAAPRGWLRWAGIMVATLCISGFNLMGAEATKLSVTSVTASADDGNVPANTLDGSLSTRWSAQGDGQWIRYDLGTAKNIGAVKIAWHNGNQRRSRFDVQS